jgi:hypothetical protein
MRFDEFKNKKFFQLVLRSKELRLAGAMTVIL